MTTALLEQLNFMSSWDDQLSRQAQLSLTLPRIEIVFPFPNHHFLKYLVCKGGDLIRNILRWKSRRFASRSPPLLLVWHSTAIISYIAIRGSIKNLRKAATKGRSWATPWLSCNGAANPDCEIRLWSLGMGQWRSILEFPKCHHTDWYCSNGWSSCLSWNRKASSVQLGLEKSSESSELSGLYFVLHCVLSARLYAPYMHLCDRFCEFFF